MFVEPDSLKKETVRGGFTLIELLITCAVIILAGILLVDFKEKIERKLPPERMLVRAAQELVSEPASWALNSRRLVEFSTAAADLGISQSLEVLNFERDAKSMITFASTIVGRVMFGEEEEVKETLGNARIVIEGSGVALGVENSKKKALETVRSTVASEIEGLTSEEAKLFMGHFEALLTSYKEVYDMLKVAANN